MLDTGPFAIFSGERRKKPWLRLSVLQLVNLYLKHTKHWPSLCEGDGLFAVFDYKTSKRDPDYVSVAKVLPFLFSRTPAPVQEELTKGWWLISSWIISSHVHALTIPSEIHQSSTCVMTGFSKECSG